MCNTNKLRNEELILYRLGELEKNNKEYQKEIMKKLDLIEKRSDELHEKQIKQELRLKALEERVDKTEKKRDKYRYGIILAIASGLITLVTVFIKMFLLGG